MATAALVFCYGVFDPSLRTKKEMRGYEEYLRGVAAAIRELRPDYVAVCGGFTNDQAEASETGSVLPHLRELVGEMETVFLLEEYSKSTPQNFEYGLMKLSQYADGLDMVTVFCDQYRGPKVRILARRFYQVPCQIRAIHRKDIHPRSSWPRQLSEAVRYSLLSHERLLRNP